MKAVFLALSAAITVVSAVQPTISDLPAFLKEASEQTFPALKSIATNIYENPELGLAEYNASRMISDHFFSLEPWQVTLGVAGLDTAFTAIFEHRPSGFDGELKTIGVLAEYDALIIGHACGHNHIALNGMTVASLAAQALVKYNIPGRIKLVGCPDEENGAGKYQLNAMGTFDDSEIWMMAHPTSSSAIQPMNSRLNLFARFQGSNHSQTMGKAYSALVNVINLSGSLPGVASTVAPIENVGVYAVNVVQSRIGLGIVGSDLTTVQSRVSQLLDGTYPNVTFTAKQDNEGIALDIEGPGGHASGTTKGPLDLSIAAYRNFSQDANIAFYLPGNSSATELDLTFDLRTRYTTDLPSVAETVNQAIGSLASGVSYDLKYPALEVQPVLSQYWVDLVSTSDYNLGSWPISTFAPASTDASWIQSAAIDPQTHQLLSTKKVVLHANYGICNPDHSTLCAFNHEPAFRLVAGTDYSYTQTESVARALAQTTIQLLTDEKFYQNVTATVS